jgi:hypothetical protein
MKAKGKKPSAIGEEEVLSDFANIKNMEWLMADAVDSIYDLFEQSP